MYEKIRAIIAKPIPIKKGTVLSSFKVASSLIILPFLRKNKKQIQAK